MLVEAAVSAILLVFAGGTDFPFAMKWSSLFTVVFLTTAGAVMVSAAKGGPPDDDDIFSSVAKMEGLVHQESAIVDYLDTYLKEARGRLEIIQKYGILFVFKRA